MYNWGKCPRTRCTRVKHCTFVTKCTHVKMDICYEMYTCTCSKWTFVTKVTRRKECVLVTKRTRRKHCTFITKCIRFEKKFSGQNEVSVKCEFFPNRHGHSCDDSCDHGKDCHDSGHKWNDCKGGHKFPSCKNKKFDHFWYKNVTASFIPPKRPFCGLFIESDLYLQIVSLYQYPLQILLCSNWHYA